MKHLDNYSFIGLKLVLPTWSTSVLSELIGKITATLKQVSKMDAPGDCIADQMIEQGFGINCKCARCKYESTLIRKDTIIRKELYERIKIVRTVGKVENRCIEKKFIKKIAPQDAFKIK